MITFETIKAGADRIGQDTVLAHDLWRQNDIDGALDVLGDLEEDCKTLLSQIKRTKNELTASTKGVAHDNRTSHRNPG
jgi:hypothetical protein